MTHHGVGAKPAVEHLKARFSTGGAAIGMILTCPHCGHTNEYVWGDLKPGMKVSCCCGHYLLRLDRDTYSRLLRRLRNYLGTHTADPLSKPYRPESHH